MVDDWRLDNDGQIDQASLGGLHDWSHGGRLGNWLTVNGKSAPEFRVKDKARIRLRLISAANARIMTFQLTNASATLIALDGAFCQPEQVTKITWHQRNAPMLFWIWIVAASRLPKSALASLIRRQPCLLILRLALQAMAKRQLTRQNRRRCHL